MVCLCGTKILLVELPTVGNDVELLQNALNSYCHCQVSRNNMISMEILLVRRWLLLF